MKLPLILSILLLSIGAWAEDKDTWVYYDKSGPYYSHTVSFPTKDPSPININVSCLQGGGSLRVTIDYEGYHWKELDGSIILWIKGPGWKDAESLHIFLRTKAANDFGFYLSDDDENESIISLLGEGYPFDVIYEVNEDLEKFSFSGNPDNSAFNKLKGNCKS